ncbi:MAG: thiamine pyrophosphate-binding protein [Chloroflexi bacterium]|nr:thiamine pyrophosphate-binding protein [Chloroflexota bacterium]
MIQREQLLQAIARWRTDQIVVYTMTAIKEWPLYSQSPRDFYVGGAMGYASSVGLGFALAQPHTTVLVLDGDGSLLMNLGSLATIAAAKPPNLIHILLENGLYELSGRVPVPATDVIRWPELARAAGLQAVYEFDDLACFMEALPDVAREAGPAFINLKVAPGSREPMKVNQALRGAVDMVKALETEFSRGRS